jgi:hypothetical protein
MSDVPVNPRGDWDDISAAQEKALRALCNTATGVAYAGNLRRFASLSTLRALHRYGLVKADHDVIQMGTVVTITPSGRARAGSPPGHGPRP